ncbi:MAG: hypothetical protein AABZ44_08900 [Elusimicrobiota bacterium]
MSGLAALLAILHIIDITSVHAQAPEVKLGLQKIFGEQKEEKIQLGIIDDPDASPEAQKILDTARWDLSVIGSFAISDVATAEVKYFQGPILDLKTLKSSKGTLVSLRILTGSDVLASKNLSDTSGDTHRLGHRIATFTLKTLTGEEGFFLSKIVFALKQKNRKEIWIADWDGKNAVQLTDWKTLSLAPAADQAGTKIAFTSYKDGNPDLYLYDVLKKSFKVLSAQQGLNTSAAFDPRTEGVVATLSRGKDPNLYMLTMSGAINKQLTRDSGIDTSPVFSPNAEEVAFTTDRSGNPQIFVMSRDGSNVRRLTYGFFWADNADWSGTGSALAFSAKYKREQLFDINVTDPFAIRFVKLTGDGGNEDPSFSPDGRFLAFTSRRNGKWEIFIKSVTSSTADIPVISFKNADAVEPVWTRDPNASE